MFSVRIVTADHYMSAPLPGLDVLYSDFRGSEVKQVPVIRIFGSTREGKKVCLHVHGVLPYIYVPYDGCEPNEREAYKLSSSLDKAINVSLGKSNATTQHVFKISLVSGRPYYGYHAKEHQFFKIYLYNPIMVKRAADLLQSGAVLNKSFQPHEAHLTFMLQFFIDFNLYGMNFISLSKVKYRHSISTIEKDTLNSISLDDIGNEVLDDFPHEIFLPESVVRMSTCELELDALATSIVNRTTVTENMTVIPGLAALWEEERERRRRHGLSSQLSPAPSQPRNDMLFIKSEVHYLERLCDQIQICKVGSSPLSASTHHESVLDTSGYPSETPENASVQNASLVEIHLPSPLKHIQNDILTILKEESDRTEPQISSQNNVLLDTQDQILMNDWEEMLEEKYEDSILGTQPPVNNDEIIHNFVEVEQEEVEDNHLLEMSQVFDWEENIQKGQNINIWKPIEIDCRNIKSLSGSSTKLSNEAIEFDNKRHELVDEVVTKKTKEFPLDEGNLMGNNSIMRVSMEMLDNNSGSTNFDDQDLEKESKFLDEDLIERKNQSHYDEENQVTTAVNEEFEEVDLGDKECDTASRSRIPFERKDGICVETTSIDEDVEQYTKEMSTTDKTITALPINNEAVDDYAMESKPTDELLNEGNAKLADNKRKLHKPPEEGSNVGTVKNKDIQSSEEDEVTDITEWDEDLWSEDDFETDFIAQLDGVDDLIEPNDKVRTFGIKNLPQPKKRLGLRGRLSSSTQDNIASSCCTVPTMPGTSTGNATRNISDGKSIASKRNVIKTDACKPKLPILVAKHKRISELQIISGLSLSNKKLKPSDYSLGKSERSHVCNEIENAGKDVRMSNDKAQDFKDSCSAQNDQRYSFKGKKLNEVKYSKTGGGQFSTNFSDICNKIPPIKPCTVRLELIDKPYIIYLYQKYGMTLSNYTLCQLDVSIDNQILSSIQLGKSLNNQNRNTQEKITERVVVNKNETEILPSTKNLPLNNDKTFVLNAEDSSSSKNLPNIKSSNWNFLKDNSFSEFELSESKTDAISLSYSPRKSSPRKFERKETSRKSSKNQKSSVSSERNYYKPLSVTLQKSPVKSKNKELTQELKIPCSATSANVNKCTDLLKTGNSKCEKAGVEVSEEHNPQKSKTDVNELSITEEVDRIKILDTRFKPLQMILSTSSDNEKRIENHSYSQSSVNETTLSTSSICTPRKILEDHDIKNTKQARKQLKYSDEIKSDFNENNESDYGKPLVSSSSDSEEDYKEFNSKDSSSSFDDDLGIMSFCEEDVFNSSVLSPSLMEKSFRKTQILTQNKFITKQRVCENTSSEEEIPKLKNVTSTSVNDNLSYALPISSFCENSSQIEYKTINASSFNYKEAFEDNGVEYAPLLKSPSWNAVANYKYDNGLGLPFCSEPDDIPHKPMEVGDVVLRLYSNRPSNLPAFDNCLGVPGLEKHRRLVLRNIFGETDELENCDQLEKISKAALLPDGGTMDAVITPCEDPPTYEDVCKWLTEKKYDNSHNRDNLHEREEKTCKIIVGCPLDDDDNEDGLEMISLSPCSTQSSQDVSERKRLFTMQSTPHSYLSSKHRHKIVSPGDNNMMISPIQVETDEDIISCTPPSVLDSEKSSSKKELSSDVKKNSWSRKRILKDAIIKKKKLATLEEEIFHTPTKKGNFQSDEELLDSKSKRNCKEDEINAQKELINMLNQRSARLGGSGHSNCQIEGISPNNTFGFQNSPSNLQDAKAIQQPEYITVMTLEVQVHTRKEFRPDPEYDSIQAIFYSVVEDCGKQIGDTNKETGILIVDNNSTPSTNTYHSLLLKNTGVHMNAVQIARDESSLFKILGELIQKWEPDILAGYEIEMQSWGYVLDRGSHLGLDVKSLISRIPSEVNNRERFNEPNEPDSKRIKEFEDFDPFNLPGRIILNVWRIMRSEAALMSYTFENVMYHLLHERVPSHSFKSLNDWWDHCTHLYRWITVEYWLIRVEGVMRLLFQLDIIGRTSELARLFGIQFYEVFSRGSQFRVESMMLRLAKPLNYICVSPNGKQRSGMRAPEQLPLIMEPESRFFADPVIVLDFQSLYPSIIIAYNYCFSTCLGRVKHLGQPGPFQFGCTNLMVPPDQLVKLLRKQKKIATEKNRNPRELISFSPCGVAFVGKEVREGILPRMLSKILETRLMVKKALKENKGNRIVERVLHSRQLGLKLIANVTYGYTSANFSGRMPCIEVGDSVVSKGRETLERAIELVHEKWGSQGVRVVYGDTDSLFVLAKGYTRDDAFKLGSQIADLVTANNPTPVKLKLEKVYQPCLLQTKKRYVGYAYETPDQEKPIFDAKGIETVRRDGCPAVAKILEKSLHLLFDTRDLSLVKLHVQRQLGKLLSGRLSLQELTFAREYRGASGYRPGACVPALQLARRWTGVDHRAEPRSGERVPYVIVSGPPGLPLFQLVRSPAEFLMLNKQMSISGGTHQPQMRINAHYYITKVLIPPLQRCFSLIGVDVESWYSDMPRKFRSFIQPQSFSDLAIMKTDSSKMDFVNENQAKHKRSTIAEYFSTSDCLACGSQLDPGSREALCKPCLGNPQKTAFVLNGRCNFWDHNGSFVSKICQSCCKRMEPIECISLDCPVLYRRHQALLEMEQSTTLRNILRKFN